MLKLDTVKSLVPKPLQASVSQELIDKLNELNKDPILLDSLKENFISHLDVLKTGKYSLEDYKNAVLFVSYKLLGNTDIDAYAKTFPDRYQRLSDSGLSRDEMSPYVSAYKKNKLVTSILERTLVPSHILNAPLHQEAINQLANLMLHSKSDMAKVAAASKLIDATAIPETAKIQLDLGVTDAYRDSIEDLRAATEKFAETQLEGIKSGISVKQIAEMNIIEVEND